MQGDMPQKFDFCDMVTYREAFAVGYIKPETFLCWYICQLVACLSYLILELKFQLFIDDNTLKIVHSLSECKTKFWRSCAVILSFSFP